VLATFRASHRNVLVSNDKSPPVEYIIGTYIRAGYFIVNLAIHKSLLSLAFAPVKTSAPGNLLTLGTLLPGHEAV